MRGPRPSPVRAAEIAAGVIVNRGTRRRPNCAQTRPECGAGPANRTRAPADVDRQIGYICYRHRLDDTKRKFQTAGPRLQWLRDAAFHGDGSHPIRRHPKSRPDCHILILIYTTQQPASMVTVGRYEGVVAPQREIEVGLYVSSPPKARPMA